MAGRGTGPDFVEALARGLDVLTCFDDRHPRMSLTEIAAATGLARPTARRLLLTLAELGFVRLAKGRVLHPHAEGAAPGHGLRRLARPLGCGPAAPGGPGRPAGESSSMDSGPGYCR